MAHVGATGRIVLLRKVGGILLRVWLPFHIFAITSWSLPTPPPAISNGSQKPFGQYVLLDFNERHIKKSFIAPYVIWTGFWQYWDMFSPDPASIDIWADQEVVFRDGSVRRHRYPRMFESSNTEKYLKERYRKFFERAGDDKFRYLWPVFAQRIAFEVYADPANPPVTVRLWRHWQVIPKPGRKLPTGYKSAMYFEYAVDQAALEEARKGR